MKNKKKFFILICLTWLLTHTLLWHALRGPQSGSDSWWYSANAQRILAADELPARALSYSGYIAIVAVAQATGGGTTSLILFQILLSGVAVGALYVIGARLYSPSAGLYAAFFYSAYLPIHQWNFYILTESTFISLSVLSLAALVTSQRGWHWAGSILLIIGTASLRPHGIILIATAIVYFLWRLAERGRWGLVALFTLLVVSGVAPAFSLVNSRAHHEALQDHYKNGTVIWGYEKASLPLSQPVALNRDASPSQLIWYFITRHPQHTLRLFFARLFYLFAEVRPFYSRLHNILSAATLYPVYALALVTLWSQKMTAHRIAPLSLAASQVTIVAFTFMDWDGRFLHAFLPAIFLVAAPSVDKALALVTSLHCASRIPHRLW